MQKSSFSKPTDVLTSQLFFLFFKHISTNKVENNLQSCQFCNYVKKRKKGKPTNIFAYEWELQLSRNFCLSCTLSIRLQTSLIRLVNITRSFYSCLFKISKRIDTNGMFHISFCCFFCYCEMTSNWMQIF